MQEVLDRARLADASEIGARGIQATVSRGEIEDVLKSKDGDPELVLDVTRGGESETSTLRLVWDADLFHAGALCEPSSHGDHNHGD